MIKVQVEDTIIGIVWQHTEPIRHRPNKMGRSRVPLIDIRGHFIHPGGTKCLVYDLAGESKELMFEGYAKVYYKDTFDKEIGRKVSMVRAIRHFNRGERKLIWETYLNR